MSTPRDSLVKESRADAGLTEATELGDAYESGFQAGYDALAAEKDDVFDKLKHCADMGAKLADEVIELRTANAELVEALKGIELEIAHDHVDGSIQIIIEALAKHGGNK